MPGPPSNYWILHHSDEVMARVHHLSVDCDPPRLRIRNADALIDYLENDWSTRIDDPVAGCVLSPPPPTIELEVTEPGFAPDLFIHETLFVSAELREAKALRPEDAQWFAVDASRSAAAVQAKRYFMLHPTRLADPVDYGRSEGVWLDVRGPDGERSRVWEARAPDGAARLARLCWRDDFVPPAPYFDC